jgi:hypothetical protein
MHTSVSYEQSATRATTTPSTVQVIGDYKDGDLVTVLYRFGDVPTSIITRVKGKEIIQPFKHYLGNVEFEGGVARDVPWSTAKHWVAGTRTVETEDGRVLVKKSYFRVNNLYVVPNDSTPAEWSKYAKIHVDDAKLASIMGAADAQQIMQVLGVDGTARLIAELQRAQRGETPPHGR